MADGRQRRPARFADGSATFAMAYTHYLLTFNMSLDVVEALLSFPFCVPSCTCPPFGISLLYFLGICSSNSQGPETWPLPPLRGPRTESLCVCVCVCGSCDSWARGYQNRLMLAGPGETKFTAHISLKREQRIKTKDQK